MRIGKRPCERVGLHRWQDRDLGTARLEPGLVDVDRGLRGGGRQCDRRHAKQARGQSPHLVIDTGAESIFTSEIARPSLPSVAITNGAVTALVGLVFLPETFRRSLHS